MISLLVSIILLFNIEQSFDDKKASSIKKAVQIIKTIHGIKWEKNMKYIMIFVFTMVVGCENIKQSIGITTKPFQSGESFKNSTKFNYKIIFGKIRPKEDDD